MMTVDRFRPGAAARGRSARSKRIDEFGVQEELEEFAQRLERRFGWQLGPPVHENVTEPVEVPDSFRARIAEDNPLDMELYEYALEAAAQAGRT